MSHLYVSVRLYGAVVDERLLPVCGVMRLGEGDDALVPFPGADLVVRSGPEGVWVRGRLLEPGESTSIALGAVQVTLEVLEPEPELHRGDLARWWKRLEDKLDAPLPVPDLRLLIATAAIALLGSFWEAAGGFVATDPVASRNMQALIDTIAPSDARNARIQAPDKAESKAEPAPPRDLRPEERWPPATFVPTVPEEGR